MAKFNREKVLRQLEFKRKWRSYSRYVYIAVPCVLCCLLCLYFAYSKFFVSEEQAVIRTTVGDFIYGDVVIGAYIDGEYSSTIGVITTLIATTAQDVLNCIVAIMRTFKEMED